MRRHGSFHSGYESFIKAAVAFFSLTFIVQLCYILSPPAATIAPPFWVTAAGAIIACLMAFVFVYFATHLINR